jgi:polygalacturonase
MKHIILFVFAISGIALYSVARENRTDKFPDGSAIPGWFLDHSRIQPQKLGKQYVVTDFGAINDSMVLQTSVIQHTIDEASKNGGGVVVIPNGIFLSGALFFKPKTHLYVVEGGVLKGSDDITNYPQMPSRMEGQNLEYFPALVNAYGVDGFTISGKGTINGNGAKYWEAFWNRRKENKNCTNLEVSRPRLLFIWNCKNVQIQDVNLHNSGFWTSHYYQCSNVKIIGLHIFSPHTTLKAPSTDAIDLDACSNVLVTGCYLSVNDDAIALKGGKGPWADKDPNNGENTNILIENCEFGFCHSALTCGSEAIHNRNILMRNCVIREAMRVLWLKMRPDTPQKYEFISVENIRGEANSLIYIKPWTQFFDLKGRKDSPLSYSENVTVKDIDLKCDIFFDVAIGESNRLKNFNFENLTIEAKNGSFDRSMIDGVKVKNVKINGHLVE